MLKFKVSSAHVSDGKTYEGSALLAALMVASLVRIFDSCGRTGSELGTPEGARLENCRKMALGDRA
jgi:hypothetical protein